MDKNSRGTNGHSPVLAKDFLHEDVGQEGAEALGGIPFSPAAGPRLVALLEQNNIGAERFRMLAGRLQYFKKKRDLKTIVITSAMQGEGKSVVSANLAFTLARRQRTLLIDGDLRQSGLKALLATHNKSGLTEWWLGDRDIRDWLLHFEGLPFWHLPAGQVPEQPLEILQSQKISDMLAQVSDWFDWIIIDSPPLVPVADGHAWATHADATLLVVRESKTVRRLLESGLESGEDLKLLGVVMNAVQESRHPYYYAQYSYGQVRPNAAHQRGDTKSTSQSTGEASPRQ